MTADTPWTTRPYHRQWLMNQADRLFDLFQFNAVNPKGGFFDLDAAGKPFGTLRQIHANCDVNAPRWFEPPEARVPLSRYRMKSAAERSVAEKLARVMTISLPFAAVVLIWMRVSAPDWMARIWPSALKAVWPMKAKA